MFNIFFRKGFLNMNKFNVLISEEALQKRISELAQKLDEDYSGKELVIICILKGSLYFTVDLTKKMKTPIILDTIHAHSYVGTETSGSIKIQDDISTNITGKDVLIVEDIIDTGLTLNKIRDHILAKSPHSLKIAVLANKPDRRTVHVPVDYVGFDIPNKFIVGYGFDYDEKYRNLPYVGYIED